MDLFLVWQDYKKFGLWQNPEIQTFFPKILPVDAENLSLCFCRQGCPCWGVHGSAQKLIRDLSGTLEVFQRNQRPFEELEELYLHHQALNLLSLRLLRLPKRCMYRLKLYSTLNRFETPLPPLPVLHLVCYQSNFAWKHWQIWDFCSLVPFLLELFGHISIVWASVCLFCRGDEPHDS